MPSVFSSRSMSMSMSMGSIARRAALAGLGAGLAACSHIVPVVPHAAACPVVDASVERTCVRPVPLAASASFQELAEAMARDRKNLVDCAAWHAELRAVLAQCNANVAEFNAQLDQINGRSAR